MANDSDLNGQPVIRSVQLRQVFLLFFVSKNEPRVVW